jgi:hypothetical protein
MYVEHKSGEADRGAAWIGRVEFSKSDQTLYFNGQAFKRFNGHAYSYSEYANYFDIETRDGYWISGIKKNGQDRHWAGGGKVMIDKNVIEEYLSMVDFEELDSSYEVVEITPTDKTKFKEIENGLA